MYLSEEQRRKFLNMARSDPAQAMLIFSRISTRQSTCWVLNDQLRIHNLIESSIGFETVDKQVHEAIARALKVAPTNSQPSQQHTGSGQRLTLIVDTAEKKESLLNWCRSYGLVTASIVAEQVDEINVNFK